MVETAKLHDRRHRRRQGSTILEGPHIVELAAAAGCAIEVVYAVDSGEAAAIVPGGIEIVSVAESVLRKLAGTEHPRGPVAVVRIPPPAPLQARNTVVLIDIGDPGNAGTIIRSAAAFGFAVAATPGTVDLWSPKVLRAAAGGHFQTAVTPEVADPVSELTALGVTTAALVVSGGDAPSELAAGPCALLVGSEAHGLDTAVSAAASRSVALPMPGGIESLNAGVAASIAMYLLRDAT